MANADTGSSFKTSAFEDEAYERARILKAEDTAAVDVFRAMKVVGAEKVCKSVVDEDSEGRYYKAVEIAFKENTFKTLLSGTPDLISVCPKYPVLSQKEKEEVWTTILGIMAFYESTCRELKPRDSGPNGKLAGPFQLHYGKERNYGYLCKKFDAVAGEERLVPCVLSMLEGYLKRSNKLFPNRKEGATYWEVLQLNAAKRFRVKSDNGAVAVGNGADFVKLAIKNYKYCK
ncbi:hypothetical protein B9G69_001660 [Bdellovibrio sp. SKB1291214]|uniref:hypothetical protein n=1 Tax=Bdellovibrio sp. SKB1291214 TaxID=1732569 RepID=UPI001C3C5BBF|nr:hypothetical protein [Bdellovibrio sp. SKB1291214]UYL09280.1 hypothetical protein B9G69_001660 [Bdellovibrio sp. SKB1291214]